MKKKYNNDLLDGRFISVVLHDIHLIHIAGVAEGDELGNPAVVEAARQL